MSPGEETETVTCKVCGAESAAFGQVYGSFSRRTYKLRRCPRCSYVFVSDPWTDWATIYNLDYYSGRGPDKLVDYCDELENVATIRRHEWEGILRWARSLGPVDQSTTWLDYGCGSGGLVTFLRDNGITKAVGFDRGTGADIARAHGAPVLTEAELDRSRRHFDIISLIEVIEHTLDPVDELRRLRSLLKPSGIVMLTTGNAAPFRRRFERWRYVVPEIHVSFFEPQTLAMAMRSAGLEPVYPGYVDGWTEIIRFKVLKNIGSKRDRAWSKLVPWGIVCRSLDMRLGLTRHPVGRVAR